MQIGIVAKKVGLSIDAIRFYERNGLLPRPPRTQGGFRRYGENDVETLAFVRLIDGWTLRQFRAELAKADSLKQTTAAMSPAP